MAREERFIVKVQLPVATNAPEPLALVYDETGGICEQFPVSEDLLDIMGDDVKKFFWAKFVSNGEDPDVGKLHIEEEAPWQSW